MIIPYGFIEAVIKRESLERTRKGLSIELIKEYKLSKVRYDDDLIVVPIGMSMYDAELKAKEIEKKYNLVHFTNDNKALDFVVCNKLFGPFESCDWLIIDYLKKDLVINEIEYKKGTTYYELKK